MMLIPFHLPYIGALNPEHLLLPRVNGLASTAINISLTCSQHFMGDIVPLIPVRLCSCVVEPQLPFKLDT